MSAFDDAWAVYQAAVRRRSRHVTDNTIDQYRIRLATWIAWLGGRGVAWEQAGPEDLDGFLARTCHPAAVHTGSRLALATRAMYARMVCDWHRVLHAKGVLAADAMAEYVPPPDPEPAGEPLELSEVARLLDYVDDHPDRRLPVMARLCYLQALRAGETATLRVSDVQLGGSVPRLAVVGKGRLERTWLPLHPRLVPALGAYTYWLAGQAGVGSARGLPAGTPLFWSRTCPGRPVARAYPSRLLARAMRDAGLPAGSRPHDLRRTAIDQVGLASGDNPWMMRYVARHRGWTAVLDHYRRVRPAQGRAYFEQIPDPTDGQGG